jgi:hypothetical protein
LSAAVSAHWLAGGTWLLSTVGGVVEDEGRQGGVLTLYCGALVAVGAVALTGVLGEPADPTALRWHVLLWDPWFLLWGCCSSSPRSPGAGSLGAVPQPGERQVAGGFTGPVPARHAGVGPPH